MNCFDERGEYNTSKIDYTSLKNCINTSYKVLALGVFPSQALQKLNIDHFRLPHPSPRNRQLNDKTFEYMMLEECKGFVYG